MTESVNEEAVYRPGKKSNLWMTFAPSGQGGTWQMQLTARNRGGSKTLAVLWETTALKPIGSVTIKGETYPLTIGWHQQRRGGAICFGGTRKTGSEGGTISWEIQIRPMSEAPQCFEIEMRLRSEPRREGRVAVHLYTPLYRPEVVSLPSAAARGHCAMSAWSSYHQHAAGFVMLAGVDDEVGWEESQGGFAIAYDGFPFGGGRAIRFALQFSPVKSAPEARQLLNDQYAAVAAALLHPSPKLRPLDPSDAICRYADLSAFRTVGIERLYPKPPASPTEAGSDHWLRPPSPQSWGDQTDRTSAVASAGQTDGDREAPVRDTVADIFYAGHPHHPLEMLTGLWDWQRLHAHPEIARLVRFGATGLAADFQVMGRDGQSEPNKGAFWDKQTPKGFSDHSGAPAHGIASNARIARALFLLHHATGEALFRQSAINICQWLILKNNEAGYFSGDRSHATRGLADDGKMFGDPCSLDGVASIKPLVLAYHATKNEVYIKAANKIADYLGGDWMVEHEPTSPVGVANVISALLVLDAEAPSERRRSVIREWASWLRVRPLNIDAPSANYDGMYGGVFDCAHAAFRLHAMESDPEYLRYGFSALSVIPGSACVATWRSIRTYFDAMLSLTSVHADLTPDFDNLRVRMGWREYTPDQATEKFLKVEAPGGEHVDTLSLVCRSNDQLLLIALAPPSVESIVVHKNGKKPLVKDLFTGSVDGIAPMHALIGETWARVGLFTIDP